MSAATKQESMTREEWLAEAERRFGPDPMKWKFVCPCCKHVTAVEDWKKAGAKEENVAFSCVGRWTGASRGAFTKGIGPCDYAGGGLFQLNPVRVIDDEGKEHRVFAFAD